MEVEVLNVAEVTPETTEQLLQFDRFKIEEGAVYEVLCPTKTNYRAKAILEMTEIPSRIIETVEITKERFAWYSIWEAVNVEVKDPILLGHQVKPDYKDSVNESDTYLSDYQYDTFFLARWGKMLAPFDELMNDAVNRLSRELKVVAMKTKHKCDMFLEDPALFVRQGFESGKSSKFYFTDGLLA